MAFAIQLGPMVGNSFQSYLFIFQSLSMVNLGQGLSS